VQGGARESTNRGIGVDEKMLTLGTIGCVTRLDKKYSKSWKHCINLVSASVTALFIAGSCWSKKHHQKSSVPSQASFASPVKACLRTVACKVADTRPSFADVFVMYSHLGHRSNSRARSRSVMNLRLRCRRMGKESCLPHRSHDYEWVERHQQIDWILERHIA
jgi:hypothetical protein